MDQPAPPDVRLRTDGAAADDPAREALLREAEAALRRLAPDLPPDAAVLLRRLFADVPGPELAGIPSETVAEAAASLYAFARERPPGEARLRVLPPGPGRGPHAVAEIVTDDMPFLVDSALAALARQGRVVRQLLHPVLAVRRDGGGRLLSLGNGDGAPDGDAGRESMMRITIGAAQTAMLPGQGTGGWPELERLLARAMADVRLAVTDFPAMSRLMRAAEGEVAGAPREGEPAAAAEFLRWLADENFVLLGHRRLDFGEGGAVAVAAGENLGLLRDPAVPVFDALRDPASLPPALRAALAEPVPISVAKANMRSTVHRPQHADVVATRVFAPDGRVAGLRLFLGLFAAAAYNRNPRSIPMLARKVDRVLALAGFDPDAHDGRALRNILDTWPRDELFQAPEAAILSGALRALDLQIRPRPALSVRRDPFGRFVSAIAWLPREGFDTRLRERVGEMVAQAYGGRLSAFYIALGDAPLARIHYIVGTDPARPRAVDEAVLEAAVAQAARSFGERLGEALAAERGEAAAAALLNRWRDAFPPAYREGATGAQGAADLGLAERALAEGKPAASLSRTAGSEALSLRLVNPGGPLPLADALPLFESLGLRAVEEMPYRLSPGGAGTTAVLHVFALRPLAALIDPDAPFGATDARFPAVLEALGALLDGEAEADGFNRLVLRSGLTWRECWLLRAMFRWLKQVGFAFEQGSAEAAFTAHPMAGRVLLDLFHARLDPDFAGDRMERGKALAAEWDALLDSVANPDEDRILARFRLVLDAVLRTNYHQYKPYVSFKIDSGAAGEMPAPKPWREVFVHSPRMEGTHLRAGPVARGGIRWSDRREDFRTEILGLMKAQRVKNVVIVPTGAKGGFVLKRPPPAADREAFGAEGVACYQTLVRGLLDITDNLDGERVVPPERVVRRDGDDPYMVVAADKGTATFSDIANALSAEYGFWLGDAFASGGSAGYDHKGMGITARGAWVMVARHFAELGHDIFSQDFTCAGVGDMSGDVFGNGLLISRRTKLVAAFDHRHVFLDPDPDPETSFAERERLFRLPRSSWADYDAAKISPGGGVFARNLKRVPLSARARELLGIEGEDQPEPAVVIRAILRMPVDLLYFGGIGTYVKAGAETQAEAGDRANDAVRVDGRELRARVVGEGANLAVTQAGRVEYARGGGRINTDALDNSAGVSTSDHEVNIKILLADAERAGAMTRPQRDALLGEMTDEVGRLVLRDNAEQSLAVSLEERAAAEALPAHAALMQRLEAAGVLDRSVAGLPDSAAMASRMATGDALTRPAICALLPLAKLWLNEAIEAGPLPDDPAFAPVLAAYFPAPLRERHADAIARHRLRRDLVAMAVTNSVANRLGCAGLGRLAAQAEPAAAARAAWIASAVFGLEEAAAALDAAPAPAAARLDALGALRRLQEQAARGFLALPDSGGGVGETVASLRPGIAALAAAATAEAASSPQAAVWRDAGLPADAAALAAAAPRLAAAPAIVRLAATAGRAPAEAASAWGAVGSELGIDALQQATAAAPAPGPFGARAKAALLDDLTAVQARLAARRLGAGNGAAAPAGEEHAAAAALAREAALAGDLAAVTVAARALSMLA